MGAALVILSIQTVVDIRAAHHHSISCHVKIMGIAVEVGASIGTYFTIFNHNRFPITPLDSHVEETDFTIANRRIGGIVQTDSGPVVAVAGISKFQMFNQQVGTLDLKYRPWNRSPSRYVELI